jgi:hypothetical protein
MLVQTNTEGVVFAPAMYCIAIGIGVDGSDLASDPR